MTKNEFYQQNMDQRITELIDLAEAGGLNIAIVVHVDEGEDSEGYAIKGGVYHDDKNGRSYHVIAVDKIINTSELFARATVASAELALQLKPKDSEQQQ